MRLRREYLIQVLGHSGRAELVAESLFKPTREPVPVVNTRVADPKRRKINRRLDRQKRT